MGRRGKHERKAHSVRRDRVPSRLVQQSETETTPRPTVTIEKYLKAAMCLSLETESKWVSNGKLAVALGVTPGSVTTMLKALSEYGLADYKPYAGISLTRRGQRLAAQVIRRHRLIEAFLSRVLNLTWDQVHTEAESMEHALSDLVVDRLDALMGCPSADPHGDPIRSADGAMRGELTNAVRLGTAEPGARFRLVRVANQEPKFLQYLSSCGLEIGVEAVIESIQPAAGTVTVRINGKQVVLSQVAAAQLLIETS